MSRKRLRLRTPHSMMLAMEVARDGLCHPLIILAAGLRPVRTGGEASGDTPHPGRGEPPAPRVMSGCQLQNQSLRRYTQLCGNLYTALFFLPLLPAFSFCF